MRPRVLITRPEPGASRTAKRLEEAGFEAVLLPLTVLKRLSFDLPAAPFDALMLTSAQALEHADLDMLPRIPVYAVGGTTAASAEKAGFVNIVTAGGSVASIADLVRRSAKPAARLLYLCGKVRRPELETALLDAGFQVTAVETYDAAPAVYADDELAARLGDAPVAAVALMSAQAAEHFAGLARNKRFERLFKRSGIVCFSDRIAEALGRARFFAVSVTEEASEDALLEHLSKNFLRG
jgi:uroporphyrinogen-III synthase